MQSQDLQKNLLSFTETSLKWCSSEAERGTDRVSGAIEQLLQNIMRVSQISKESLEALESLQLILKAPETGNIQQLKKSLGALAKENREIDGFISPILSSLQFQDRLRQNLENIVKMLKIWLDMRSGIAQGVDAKAMLDFGKKLLGATTMKRERDLIRAAIPGLDPEVESENVLLF